MRPLLFILVVSVSDCVGAQDLPNPEPGTAHKVLARNVGTWDCEVKMFFQGPDSPPSVSKGVEVNNLVSGDLYLETSFTCQMGDRRFEGHSLTGYDPRSKQYVGTWVDNFSTMPMQLKGTFDEKSQTHTVHSTVVDEAGHELKQRKVTTWIDDSEKKVEVFWIVEEDGKKLDVKIMEMTARRRN